MTLPRPTLRLLGALAMSAGLALAGGCGVSPQPEPPSFLPPSIDLSLVGFGSDEEGGLTLVGEPGAVTNGATLGEIDLDATTDEVTGKVERDGSFVVALTGASTDVRRLQAHNRELSSDPVDVREVTGLQGGGGLVKAPGALDDCLFIAPDLELGPVAPGTTTMVKLINRCESAVTVSAVTLRQGSPAWGITAATPIDIPLQATRSFAVRYSPQPGDAIDDVLFVELTAPTTGRRAITLRGEAP